MQTIEIACCFDRAFAAPAAVLATSILVHARQDRRYRLHVLYDGEDSFAPEVFRAFAETQLAVVVHRIRNPFADLPTSRASLSPAAFVRLALPELLPDCARVLYLDVDTLCRSDIGPLFDTPLGEAPLAASIDPPMANILAIEKRHGTDAAARSFTYYLEHDLMLGHAKHRYFNSGVLVLDLDRLRKEEMTARAHALLARLGDVIRFDDQCVLNALYAARYQQFSFRWNTMLCPPRWRDFGWGGVQLMTRVAEAFQDPAVLHFCQNSKPWKNGCDETTFAPLWRAYALAAPLPISVKLRLILSAPRVMPRYLLPSVRVQAAGIRSVLRAVGTDAKRLPPAGSNT
jgi:lipopolysaccharide biosynthesis glycosyltransferase